MTQTDNQPKILKASSSKGNNAPLPPPPPPTPPPIVYNGSIKWAFLK